MDEYPPDPEDAKAALAMFIVFLVSLLLWLGIIYGVLWLMS